METRISSELRDAVSDLRSQFAVAIATIPRPSTHLVEEVHHTRSHHYDLPAAGSVPATNGFSVLDGSGRRDLNGASTSGEGASNGAPIQANGSSSQSREWNGPMSAPTRRSVFPGMDEYEEEEEEEDDDGRSPTRGGRMVEDEEARNHSPAPFAMDEDEILPAYTPRQRALPPPLPTRQHVYKSSSGKLTLDVKAAGDAHILLMQNLEEGGKTVLEGQLIVNLPSPEQITHIKIRLKAIVRTMVMRVHGSGRHPVNEDLLIWEDSKTLYTSTTGDNAEVGKLSGTTSYPFSLHLPSRVSLIAPARKVRLPPSFVLATDATGHSTDGGGRGTEWASCRYFVKVTLGRKGFFKVSERITVPLIYSPILQPPTPSPARMVALAQNLPAPGPLDDPTGWGGKKVKKQVKRGIFSGKKAWYEVVLLVPNPAKFARLSEIEYAIKIVSSDPGVTTQFPPESVWVGLVQRSFVSAQGLSGTHDICVGRTQPTVDGPEDGTWIQKLSDDENEPVWGKRFTGSLKLVPSIGSSFRVPNLVVQFYLTVRVTVPGGGNDAEVAWPVELIPTGGVGPRITGTTRPIPVGTRIAEGSTGRVTPPPPPIEVPSSPQDPSLRLGLPPSYFVETGR
ncbi:hypothetical protein T439DRAFT_323903 [Meredithblackwellia eburnea MCA 4105]